MKAASRDKHTPLNNYISFETPFFDGKTDHYAYGTDQERLENPETIMIGREELRERLGVLKGQLSGFEAKVLGLYLNGLSYDEIAAEVKRSRNRWTTLSSASGARWRGISSLAISAQAERKYYMSQQSRFILTWAKSQREGIIMFEDKTLVCKECGKEFVFTAGEQEFYAERGFQNEPQRCKSCRDARKNAPVAPVSTSPPPALPAAARPGFLRAQVRSSRLLQRVLCSYA